MLATYRSYEGCCAAFRAVCWQPTGLIRAVGLLLGLYVGSLMPYEGCWTAFRAVCWQPTGLMRAVGPPLGLYVGNLHAL